MTAAMTVGSVQQGAVGVRDWKNQGGILIVTVPYLIDYYSFGTLFRETLCKTCKNCKAVCKYKVALLKCKTQ